MKCGYIVIEYKLKICKFCKICLNISMLSDFIIGFLGEMDVDFEVIMDLIKVVDYDFSFSFIYSVCLGIFVVDVVDDVSEEIKK